jgi:hypothetical protein
MVRLHSAAPVLMEFQQMATSISSHHQPKMRLYAITAGAALDVPVDDPPANAWWIN